MSFGSDSLGLYVSIRALLYKVVINVHMSMRSLLYIGPKNNIVEAQDALLW